MTDPTPDPSFVLETDEAPDFWQFLNGLRSDDLVIELIVNELDAGSTETTLSFVADRLICEGNGAPVDANGWARLRKMKGAGNVVKAKEGLFGVKNHGLKACFTLGDDIFIRSAGKLTQQTLFAEGRDEPAFPGAWERPIDDPEAPVKGARIEVPYRSKPFTAPHGEPLSFPTASVALVESLFTDAVASLPTRLLGIIRPGVLETYTLTLEHHALGRRTFHFRLGRVSQTPTVVTFFRRCNDISGKRSALLSREQAMLAPWAPPTSVQRPKFFSSAAYRINGRPLFRGEGLVIEVAWPVDAHGRLKTGVGQLRYPVGYSGKDEGAATQMGVHYSGPFVSNTERHGLGAQADDWNKTLIEACDAALAKALATVLIPRHGAMALASFSDLPDPSRRADILSRLLDSRALPSVDTSGRTVPVKRGALLIVPTYSDNRGQWQAALAKVAPTGSPILDPKTPPPLVNQLASNRLGGWGSSHLRFDETDVLERLERPQATQFPWRSDGEWRRALSNPAIARDHLDALLPWLTTSVVDRPTGQNAHLPDGDGRLQALAALKRGVSMPSELLGANLPPVIHPLLRDHAVFKLEGWKLDAYDFRDMLADGDLDVRPAAARRRFFSWLSANPSVIARHDWPAVKALSIWPATDGGVLPFDALCLASPGLAKVLKAHVHRPAAEVRALCAQPVKDRNRLRLRTDPLPEEVAAYYRAEIARYSDGPLGNSAQTEFRAFESSLAILARSRRLIRGLAGLGSDALALNRAGWLRPVADLVRETPEVKRLRLLPEDLLDRSNTELDAVFPSAARPTVAMALRALHARPAEADALLPRLKAATAGADEVQKSDLRRLACLPVGGVLRAPGDLAFKGNKGDFWGDWKSLISATGLSDEAQALYRAAGVFRSIPDPATSRAFFEWISTQPLSTVRRNLASIIRHIAHPHGVGAWRLQPPELPCIPVEAAGGVELLTLSNAQKFAVVDDFPELADAIRLEGSADHRLAIHSVETSVYPVADQLKIWGVPALSSLARGPLSATGRAPTAAPPGYLQAAQAMASGTTARRFRKQLQELDVATSLIDPLFQRRLAAIKQVTIASDLTAQFRIGKRRFSPRREWAVLSNEIWLNADGETDDLLMAALADLVFVKPRPRYMPAILKAALSTSARDYRPTAHADFETDDGVDVDDDESGEATHRHPGGAPDAKRNQPKPKPIYTGAGKPERTSKSGGSGRTKVESETIQRRQLKAEHYAYHCQLELARRGPHEMAPTGSYAEFAENRSRMMEAHHPDKVSATGSRHAGNLLILTRTNHERVGVRLSRGDITHALLHAWAPRTIMKADGTIWAEGGVAAAVDPVDGEVFPFFFTHDHRNYWLEMAGQKSE